MKKRTSLVAICAAVAGMAAAPAFAAEISTNAALMQAMDKVTGRVNKITVPVNSKIAFGDFSLVLRACKKRPAEETPENFAFVDVADKSFGTDEYSIFRGWMLSSAPGMNAIEHPIYDVWLLECIDTDIDASKLLTSEELAQRDNLPDKDVVLGKAEPKIIEEKEDVPSAAEPEKVIRIQEFMQQDRDIEKDIRNVPAYISESSASYVSDVEEGEEPQNLLQFTKMQEVKKSSAEMPETENTAAKVRNFGSDAESRKENVRQMNGYHRINNPDDDLSAAIDAEIKGLEQY